MQRQINTRQVSSMIHAARSKVTLVANIVFCYFVFLDLKSGDGRTDNMYENIDSYRSRLWFGRVDQYYETPRLLLSQLFFSSCRITLLYLSLYFYRHYSTESRQRQCSNTSWLPHLVFVAFPPTVTGIG